MFGHMMATEARLKQPIAVQSEELRQAKQALAKSEAERKRLAGELEVQWRRAETYRRYLEDGMAKDLHKARGEVFVLRQRMGSLYDVLQRSSSGQIKRSDWDRIMSERVQLGPFSVGRTVKVAIISATGLRNADSKSGNVSDPYCVVSIAGRASSKLRTPTVRNDLSPVWNYRGELQGLSRDDNLVFEVFDEDKYNRDDFLGRVVVSADRLMERGGFNGELPLVDSRGHGATLRFQLKVEASPTSPSASASPTSQSSPSKFSPGGRSISSSSKDLFKSMDKNNDGAISQKEFSQATQLAIPNRRERDLAFEAIDTNNDGVISPGELDAAVAKTQDSSSKRSSKLQPPPSLDNDDVDLGGNATDLHQKSHKSHHDHSHKGDASLGSIGGNFSSQNGHDDRSNFQNYNSNNYNDNNNNNFGSSAFGGAGDGQAAWGGDAGAGAFGGQDNAYGSMDGGCGGAAGGFGSPSAPQQAAWGGDGASGFGGQDKAFGSMDGGCGGAAGGFGSPSAPQQAAWGGDGAGAFGGQDSAAFGSMGGGGEGARLRISLVGAKGLRNADWSITGNNKSDPYTVVRHSGKRVYKTQVIRDNLNPVWNEEVTIDNFTKTDSIRFEVFDKDRAKKDDKLGNATLTALRLFADGGYKGDLPLEDAGKGITAFLTLEVEVIGGGQQGGGGGGGGDAGWQQQQQQQQPQGGAGGDAGWQQQQQMQQQGVGSFDDPNSFQQGGWDQGGQGGWDQGSPDTPRKKKKKDKDEKEKKDKKEKKSKDDKEKKSKKRDSSDQAWP